MEKYIEIVVPRKNSIKDTVLCFAASVVPMLLGTYIVILFYASASSLFLALGVVACAFLYYLSYKVFNNFNIEWEYTLVDSEIRFSKVINKTKRRDIITVNLSKTEIIARVNDGDHNHPYKTFQGAKYSMISQKTDDFYYIISFTDKGKRVCVTFEPDERMKENFNTTLRSKFFI